MTTTITTLRPGLLVTLKSSVTGGVKYDKTLLEAARVTKEGVEQAKWETKRTIYDPKEHDAAVKARSRACQIIRSVCNDSSFGLLCPEADRSALDAAVLEARKMISDYNNEAKLTRISLYVLAGRIAPNDAEAVRAINSEVRELMAIMEQGIKSFDVKAIRDAAARARNLGSMLNPDAEAKVQIAVETARRAATAIKKAAEEGQRAVDEVAIRKITDMRTAFLDVGEDITLDMPESDVRVLDQIEDATPSRAVSTGVQLSQLDLGE